MKTKYFNDAIIGNKNLTASYNKEGELLRIFDFKTEKQYVDFFETGIKVNDSNLIYTHKDINNTYKQKYIEDTNVLLTEIKNTYFNIKIVQTDFICINNDVLIKRYAFTNKNKVDLDLKFLIHSKLHSGENNFIGAKVTKEVLTQYCHEYNFNIFSNKSKIHSHQINDTKNNITTGEISDKDYIGMSSDSSIIYDLGIIKPDEKKTIDILININDMKLQENEEEISRIIKIDTVKEQAKVASYWKKYLKKHNTIELKEIKTMFDKKMEQIYKRSILLFPLLSNNFTGGMIASMEIDEQLSKCGRYAYCWPRDAVFITKALDILEMGKETEKFYKNFCKKTQSDNGMWEQRFYTDGKLAPCWGYQIDETASVVFGVYSHYEIKKEKKFLKDTLKMCEKATKFLKKYIKDVIEEKNKMHVSYDLWEMHEGIHLYSLSSIFGAFSSMNKIYDEIYNEYEKNRIKQEKIRKEKKELEELLVCIKKYILENLYDNNQKSFVRNIDEKNMDISILGAVTPFNVFTPKESKIINTAQKIDLTLRTYTGGYKRFENDNYMDGNPWTIATLWMALYHIEKGEKKKAKECLSFVIKTASENGLISEQINNDTLKPEWVIGLGWAHAMYIMVLEKLYKN